MFSTGGCIGNCCRKIRLHVAEPFHDATDEVWCFCPVTQTCTRAQSMLKPRTMHTAVTCLDRVYVMGGRTRGSTGDDTSLLEVLGFVIDVTLCQKAEAAQTFCVCSGGVLQPSDPKLVLSQPAADCPLLPRGQCLWQHYICTGIRAGANPVL